MESACWSRTGLSREIYYTVYPFANQCACLQAAQLRSKLDAITLSHSKPPHAPAVHQGLETGRDTDGQSQSALNHR